MPVLIFLGSPRALPEQQRQPEGARELPRCDERHCSSFPLLAFVRVTAVCLCLFMVAESGNVVTLLLIGAIGMC